MAEEVYMDIPAVTKMADNFGSFGDILKGVSKGLQTAILILKATAFVGLVGNYAVAAWLERIKPKVDDMAKKMDELKSDIQGAINHYTTGDTTGSARFR